MDQSTDARLAVLELQVKKLEEESISMKAAISGDEKGLKVRIAPLETMKAEYDLLKKWLFALAGTAVTTLVVTFWDAIKALIGSGRSP